MRKVAAIIPIKLHNQRLPGKNVRPLGEKVLCQYLFDTVQHVENINKTYVFCSDESIKRYIPDGIEFLKRPKELDADTVKSKDILQEFINMVDAEIYVLMHVTQPFITRKTITEAIEKVKEGDYDSAFAARQIKEFAWYNGKPINYSLTDVVRTQELQPIYVEGELFVFKKEVFTKHGCRIGNHPWIQSIGWKESICIDDMEDFEMAEAIIALEKKTGEGSDKADKRYQNERNNEY